MPKISVRVAPIVGLLLSVRMPGPSWRCGDCARACEENVAVNSQTMHNQFRDLLLEEISLFVSSGRVSLTS